MEQQTKELDPKISELLEEIRQKHGKIEAHPYMYISGIHNKCSYCPVDQNDPFFAENNIEFIELPNDDDNDDDPTTPPVKYVFKQDDAGTYRHVVQKK